MAQQINIPGSGDPYLQPSNGTFYFSMASPCTICFGPSNPPNAFPDLANQTFSNWGFQSPSFPIPGNATAWIQFNTSGLGTPCNPSGGLAAAPRIIHVGQGVRGNVVGGSSGKVSTPAKKKKSTGKGASAKPAAKSRPKKTAKKAGKKAAKKAGKKAAKKATKRPAKKAAKSRKAGKGRRR